MVDCHSNNTDLVYLIIWDITECFNFFSKFKFAIYRFVFFFLLSFFSARFFWNYGMWQKTFVALGS